MDAIELRIGNLVIDQEDGNIMQITSGCSLNHPELMLPIPLTEEWLIKFSIPVKDDNPKQKPHYEGDILFYVLEFEFTNSMKDGFVCYSINNGNTKIKYVHQLQNLYFALTGEELTLNQ